MRHKQGLSVPVTRTPLPSPGTPGLTDGESQVVTMAATMNDMEIAEFLGISKTTVEWRLTSARRKASIRPRLLPLPPMSTPGLTPREKDVIKLSRTLLDGDVATILGVGVITVQRAITSARNKYKEAKCLSRL